MSLMSLTGRQPKPRRFTYGAGVATILAWCVFAFLFALVWQSAAALF